MHSLVSIQMCINVCVYIFAYIHMHVSGGINEPIALKYRVKRKGVGKQRLILHSSLFYKGATVPMRKDLLD